MRVFLTGATGFVGSAVAQELIAAGHSVLGLARSDEGVCALRAAGVEPLRGNLEDVDGLLKGVEACEGVIQCGFNHDFSKWFDNIATDKRAVEAMAGAMEGTNKPFIVTFGTAGLAWDRPGTEADPPMDIPQLPRGQTEAVVMAAAQKGVRAIVLRLPPTTHGAGEHGFIPMLIEAARAAGFAGYVGEGTNRWSACHRLDAARLYRLALENAPAGARLHAVAEEGVPFRAIAETIGQGLGAPVRSLTPEEAGPIFGFLAPFAGAEASATSTITRQMLGWEPRESGLLADMRANYFG